MLPWPAIIGAIIVGAFSALMHYDRTAPIIGGITIMALSLWVERERVREAISDLSWGGFVFLALASGVRFLNAAGLMIGASWMVSGAPQISN